MISRIYLITNDINEKVYVGKTNLTIEERFSSHYKDSQKDRCADRPLYRAINKYGIEHFKVSLIEECDADDASQREIFWIAHYNSYKEGYNATLGGDGTSYCDYPLIEKLLREGKTTTEIAAEVGCCKDTVYQVAKNNDLPLNNISYDKVICYDKEGNFIREFANCGEAGKWLVENHFAKTYNGGVRSHIREASLGIRKTAYGFKWAKYTGMEQR